MIFAVSTLISLRKLMKMRITAAVSVSGAPRLRASLLNGLALTASRLSGLAHITSVLSGLARITPVLSGLARITSVLSGLALISCVFTCTPVQSMDASTAGKADPSFAHIVVRKANYLNASKNAKLTAPNSLKEIARETMYRFFGKDCRQSTGRGGTLPPQHPAVASLDDGTPTRRHPDHATTTITDWANSFKVEPQFAEPAGVFVTLSKNGKTRACWGSVYPREANVVKETVLAMRGALSKEYRYKAISPSELKDLKIQVTVIRGLEPVTDVKQINPFKDGVMVRSGGRGGVILPGEAVDSYYEFVLARLKAGIQPNEPCQIYKIRAEIYD